VVSFNGNRFCVKRVSYADLRLEDPCLRAIDAMSWDFLERTREHCSAFTQSIAIPSNNTRRPFAFLAAERRCPAGDAHAPPHHGPGRVPTTGIARDHVAGAQLLARRRAPSQSARRRDARALRIQFDRSKRLILLSHIPEPQAHFADSLSVSL